MDKDVVTNACASALASHFESLAFVMTLRTQLKGMRAEPVRSDPQSIDHIYMRLIGDVTSALPLADANHFLDAVSCLVNEHLGRPAMCRWDKDDMITRLWAAAGKTAEHLNDNALLTAQLLALVMLGMERSLSDLMSHTFVAPVPFDLDGLLGEDPVATWHAAGVLGHKHWLKESKPQGFGSPRSGNDTDDPLGESDLDNDSVSGR